VTWWQGCRASCFLLQQLKFMIPLLKFPVILSPLGSLWEEKHNSKEKRLWSEEHRRSLPLSPLLHCHLLWSVFFFQINWVLFD
jgi:hypothetical protein